MTEARKEKIKTTLWGAVGGAIVTMIIGFAWGGWVLGSDSQDMGKDMAEAAVIERLAPMCVMQFNQDPERDNKLQKLKETDSWKRGQYVREQGWATMPFEKEADSRVADRCTELIMEKNP